MAFTYDLTKPTGQLRLQIGDGLDAQGAAFFSDEELELLLTQQSGDVSRAAIQALRIWARRLASQPKQQIGDYTYDPAQQARALMTAADALAEEVGNELDDPIVGEAGGDLFVRF